MNERDYQALQESGNRAGLEKLRENEHKGGWKDISVGSLIHSIQAEVEELKQAYDTCGQDRIKEMRREAADVRNYCDMLIQKCETIIRSTKELGNG